MVSGKEMLVSRSGSLLAATTLIALLVVPMGLHAQETRRIILQPPTGWFGVRISDQAMVDERGNAFFDSYPVITHVDSGSPAAKAGVSGKGGPGDPCRGLCLRSGAKPRICRRQQARGVHGRVRLSLNERPRARGTGARSRGGDRGPRGRPSIGSRARRVVSEPDRQVVTCRLPLHRERCNRFSTAAR